MLSLAMLSSMTNEEVCLMKSSTSEGRKGEIRMPLSTGNWHHQLPFSIFVLGWGPQNARNLFGTIQLKSPFSTFCKHENMTGWTHCTKTKGLTYEQINERWLIAGTCVWSSEFSDSEQTQTWSESIAQN